MTDPKCVPQRKHNMIASRPSTGWNIRRVTTRPGEMLLEEFLKPLGITQHQLALELRVPANRIGQIIRGTRGISPDTALRLARYFGNSPEFSLNLQQLHDLSKARQESAKWIEEQVRPMKRIA